MRKNKALSEDKKLQIAELYDKGELSVGAIAEHLGVSLRTVHNYKDHKEELPSESIVTKKERSYNFEKHRWEPEETESTEEPKVDSVETDEIKNYGTAKDARENYDKKITYVGGRKFKPEEPEEEEFEHECAECGHEFNGNPSNCPECGMEFGWDGNSENKGSLDLGKIALAIGGIATVGYLIHRARKNNQNLSQSSWNDQETPLLYRVLNNQNQW